MRPSLVWGFMLLCTTVHWVAAQEKVVIVPKRVERAARAVNDSTDLFAKAYRFFIEGEPDMAADSLRKLIALSGLQLNPAAYYIVVANFTDRVSPIGMFHGNASFLDTRLYGLKSDTLYYLFIARTENAPSFVSVMLKTKKTPFEANLPAFLQLIGFGLPGALEQPEQKMTWLDLRRFEIPPKFQKISDISVIVKKSLEDDRYLAAAVFDNTPLERWSYGIATAITTLNDVTLEIGEDGTIVVRPKPRGDLAAFGVINFHFKPVDTKAPSLASSLHLLGGLRLATHIEPLLGVGMGLPIAAFELHVFAGGSLAFQNELRSGFQIGQRVLSEQDPFKLKLKAYPRFGLEVKFP
ncbi:MAG: hypothetical protein ONB48_05850 [candidate division KSB1 bacterium]|nr:hypothetical protein [candidate division KSB1 bacterium]MDZ7273071.1 hypothetical protein [candidate division KSB1 bacterium]MDZ7285174.1 hypothetical protein [candidate division KSB1 bacterium]MDZ7298206.1 hypothetical protein [candidate division KSB1 bacterium]MDZ7306880.1 hypothetical protein [candidate division KSB1 bacterium]